MEFHIFWWKRFKGAQATLLKNQNRAALIIDIEVVQYNYFDIFLNFKNTIVKFPNAIINTRIRLQYL